MPPKPRKQTSGFRQGRVAYGQVPEHRLAWLENHHGTFAISSYFLPDDDSEKVRANPGPGVILTTPKFYTYNFSELTLDELEKTREFFSMLFDLAEPVVRERDRKAHELAADGYDTVYRNYRRPPSMVVREGTLEQYRESISFGPDPVHGERGDANGGGERAGESGDVLAPAEPEHRSSEDNGAETDEP